MLSSCLAGKVEYDQFSAHLLQWLIQDDESALFDTGSTTATDDDDEVNVVAGHHESVV